MQYDIEIVKNMSYSVHTPSGWRRYFMCLVCGRRTELDPKQESWGMCVPQTAEQILKHAVRR
jgi:hypothetical protein